ncbi:unnamed protein product [Adineta steineri]|uniref:Chitin-binding type-4 domain-containing protein n=1 Tax=Adineta steineri TaxID=433720 RepID=A0A815T842_9BILA|nr:unnamed protein product [Adineta steineri]CAF1502907.1 unnamed protein product [Adineta steineri]CAF3802278.1 unnamed protein product [Adineta steineri]CAF3807296.1 unnamed protein product [Adineta steineri]
MLYSSLILIFIQCFYIFEQCHGHGYLADPPARSSAWLFDADFATCCQYFNHAQMSCGGAYYQWAVQGGKCSICGEAHDIKPRLLGRGDAMYLGKIVRTYIQGSFIPVTVVLTANHRGVFEFRLCNIEKNNLNEDATQSCLDLNLLNIVHGSTKYFVEATFTTIHVNVSLPASLTCDHCVFQWKYITGNSWGVANGKACVGCGEKNEEFYGCSDIAIRKTTDPIIELPPPSTQNVTKTPEISRKCVVAVTFSRSFDLTALVGQYCHTICSNNCASDKDKETVELLEACRKSCDKLCTCK